MLCGVDVNDVKNHDDMLALAHQLLGFGSTWVLVKGGHFAERSFTERRAPDVLVGQGEVFVFDAERVTTTNDHGTGCSLSAAICAGLALGEACPTRRATPNPSCSPHSPVPPTGNSAEVADRLTTWDGTRERRTARAAHHDHEHLAGRRGADLRCRRAGVFMVINLISDQGVTKTPATVPVVVGGLAKAPSTAVLNDCKSSSEVPSNINDVFIVPVGTTSSSAAAFQRRRRRLRLLPAAHHDHQRRVTTQVLQIPTRGPRLESVLTGSSSGKPQSLFQKAGNDGFYWVAGISVTKSSSKLVHWTFRIFQNSETV